MGQRTRTQWSPNVLRRFVLHRLRQLGLGTPFTWQAYIEALQHENTAERRERRLEVVRAPLPPGTFGQLIVRRQAVTGRIGGTWRLTDQDGYEQDHLDRAGPGEEIVESLLVPFDSDDDHLERVVFHELGHRELGHITCETSSAARPRVFACQHGSPDQHERDAETFATMVIRLAHGWDPGVIHAPCLDRFFDLLS